MPSPPGRQARRHGPTKLHTPQTVSSNIGVGRNDLAASWRQLTTASPIGKGARSTTPGVRARTKSSWAIGSLVSRWWLGGAAVGGGDGGHITGIKRLLDEIGPLQGGGGCRLWEFRLGATTSADAA